MKVILFNPSPRQGFQAHRRVELPLNLLHPATPLVHAGFDVKIIDQFADPDWERKFQEALLEKPICFGVSCMTGPQIIRALAACKAVKERYPDVPTVWGGIHPTILPEQTLQNPLVDVVVVGEGEATLLELVKALANGEALNRVAGIGYRENGSIRLTEPRPFVDLNAQPPLAYDLIDINLYRRKIFSSDHVSFSSSRGCPFRCGFCYDNVVHKRKWRALQPERVVEELKRLTRDYGIHGFNFTDDNLFTNMDHAHRLMDQIARADMKIKIGKLHIRIDSIRRMDSDFLDLLARVGVERLTIGVESGNQRILDLIEKSLRVEYVLEASRKLISRPFLPAYLFMMGLPTETPEELAQSVRLAEQLLHENPKAAKSFNIYTPYPGTTLYQVAVEMGMKEPQRLEDWSPLNYRHVPTDAPWIVPETKKLVFGLDFPLMFLGTNFQFKKVHPIVKGLGRLYLPLAQYRVRNMDARFPIETKVVKALGLFGREGLSMDSYAITHNGEVLGYVAIDSTIAGRSCGGLRMLPDVDEAEIAGLARAMTLKYGFLGLPQGGAKAGVRGDPEAPPEARRERLLAFGREIAPMLRSRRYAPHPDMGTNNTDIRELLQSVGVPVKHRELRVKDSGYYTALTVMAGVKQGARHLGLDLSRASVAIEGFGKVGGALGGLLAAAQVRVVAVSTSRGALYNPRGLDMKLLCAETRSDFVERYRDADRLDRAALLELPVDVLCPCARHDSIHAGNAARIAAKLVSPGANNPVTPEAEKILSERSVLCLPDFVTNSGGVLGGTMEFAMQPREAIERFVDQYIGARIACLLGQPTPPRELAERDARERFTQMQRAAEHPTLKGRLMEAGLECHRRGWAPGGLIRKLSVPYFEKRLRI